MILNEQGKPYALGSAFEGASNAPRMTSYLSPTVGPNSAIGNSLTSLRGRSRQLFRNNPLAKGGKETFTSNMVGSGITPRFQFKDNPELKEEIQELWQDSVPELDFDENLDFYGMQTIVSDTVFSDGEILALYKPQSTYADLAVPFQVQLLETDHLDVSYTTFLSNGNPVRMGIEYNKQGKKIAYWLHKDHPGEYAFFNNSVERVRIPKSQIEHIFDPTRPGQQRGLPSLSSIIVKLNDIDTCVDAELVRRKSTAMFGGFIEQIDNFQGENGNNPPPHFGIGSKDNGIDIYHLEPGTWPVLPPGKKVNFAEPKDVSGNYVAWMKQQLMDVSRGMGITYEQLSGDLEGVTYGSIRAGLLEFRRLITMKRNKTIIFQFCRPIIIAWLETAILLGKIKSISIADYMKNKRKYWRGINWQGQPWAWIDPFKDIMGEIADERAGHSSRSMNVAARGLDIENLDNEISDDNIRADKLGLIFDTDPRKVTKTGLFQKMVDDSVKED